MARHDLAWPGLAGYLDAVESRLGGTARWRASVRDELADGLLAAAEAELASGRAVDRAAAVRRALTGFGRPEVVAASFAGEAAAGLARRTGLGLLASGPLAALCWVAALAASGLPVGPHRLGGAWTAPIAGLTPAARQLDGVGRVLPAFGVVIAVTAGSALLAVVAGGRAGRWLGRRSPRLPVTAAALATGLCAAADALAVSIFVGWVAAAPGAGPGPAALPAVAFSLVRLTLAARASRRCGAAAARLA